MADPIAVYLEEAPKRTFAGATDWPGWARSGRTAEEALANLAAYRDRYADVLRAAHLRPPSADAALAVREHLAGGSGTEYGVASAAPAADDAPLDGDDVDRLLRFLDAAWDAFDRAVRAVPAVRGGELLTGPRGGGRSLAKMAAHLLEADNAYIGALGGQPPAGRAGPADDPLAALAPMRAAMREALRAKARGELADLGPRGGRRWSGRYFVRRAAWHALDHAWEVEDRTPGGDGGS
jgi:hypothetical protein